MPAIVRNQFDTVYAVEEAELCNLALGKIGVDPMLTTEEDTKTSRACKAAYSFARDKLLRGYPFNFATRSADISEDASPSYPLNGYTYSFKAEDRLSFTGTMTLGDDQITAIPAAGSAGGILLDDTVLGRVVYGSGVPDNSFIIAHDATARTVTLDRVSTAAASSFSCGLPLLSVISVGANKDNLFEVVGGGADMRILTDIMSYDSTLARNFVEMKYIKRIVNPAEFDYTFREALVARIAYEVCLNLTKSGQLYSAMQSEFMYLINEAKKASAKEKQLSAPDPYWTSRSGETNDQVRR